MSDRSRGGEIVRKRGDWGDDLRAGADGLLHVSNLYWTSPAGKTPAATLYSALLREVKTKANQARFQKAARGQFVFQNPKTCR